MTCLLFLLFISEALAATIRVPSEQPTIQAGIDASVDGDTVLVAGGTYTGAGNKNLDYCGKAVTVLSENGPAGTILDCENDGRGFYFGNGEDSSSRLEGFTIRNGNVDDDGGAILCYDSSPAVADCIISSNTASGWYSAGGGVYCFSSPSAVFTGCTITGNSAEYKGGGICCQAWSFPIITDCTISGNSAGDYGGGIQCDDSSPEVTNCIIIDNTGSRSGGGIYCWNSSPAFSGCSISGNAADAQQGDGGGVYCGGGSSPAVSHCTISENTALSDGGGVYCTGSSPIIGNTTISGNEAGFYGGGVYGSDTDLEITGSVIRGNSAEEGGGIHCRWYSRPTMTNVVIAGKAAGIGGGVYSVDSDPVLTNCTVTGNTSALNGGGFFCDDSSYPVMISCIFWNDSPEEIHVRAGKPSVIFSDVQGGWSGPGNIDADPFFVMEEWGDQRLCWGSPCIDTGKSGSVDPDGTRIDMGANYFDQSRELIVYLSPETDEIASGDSGSVRYTVCNSKLYEISFGAAAAIRQPSGAPWPGNPLEEPLFMSIAPSGNETRDFAYLVPPGWVPGTYSFAAGVGYGGRIYDLDHFEFTVVDNDGGE